MRARTIDDTGEPWHIKHVLQAWLREHETELACEGKITPARMSPPENHNQRQAAIMSNDDLADSGGQRQRQLSGVGEREDAHARGAMPVW